MSGPHVNEYGDVISSALMPSENKHASEKLNSEFSLMRGQIQEIYAADNPKNNLGGPGVATLYDVAVFRPDGGTELIRRCRMLQPGFGGGFNNFFEVLPSNPGPLAKDAKVNGSLKPGSHVLVGFISGQKTSGMILGALPHPSKVAVAARPKTKDGVHMEGEFQGFNFQIRNDGSLKLTFNGPKNDEGKAIGKDGPTTLEIDAQGSLRIKTNAQQDIAVDRVKKEVSVINGTTSLKMEQNGSKITMESDYFTAKARKDVYVEAGGKATVKSKGEATVASDTMIKLQKGDKQPDEPFVLGKVFVKFMTNFLKATLTHTHIGNMGFPTPPPINASEFSQLISSPIGDESILSKHIIGEK